MGDELLIFDLGTGARRAGRRAAAPRQPVKASIFLSHYHYDHLQGLPFFTPDLRPAERVHALRPAAQRAVGEGDPRRADGAALLPGDGGEGLPGAARRTTTFSAGETLKLGEAQVQHAGAEPPGRQPGLPRGVRGPLGGVRDRHRARQRRWTSASASSRGARTCSSTTRCTPRTSTSAASGPPRTGWGHSTWQAAVQAADEAAGEDAGALPPRADPRRRGHGEAAAPGAQPPPRGCGRAGTAGPQRRLSGARLARDLRPAALTAAPRQRADGRGDVRQLRHGRHLERVGQADARDVLAGEELGRRQQLVEELVDGAADEVLAEVRHLGVLVDEQHAARLLRRSP